MNLTWFIHSLVDGHQGCFQFALLWIESFYSCKSFFNMCFHFSWAKTKEWNCWDVVQFSSVAQSCPTLCDPMNRSMPGLPVHHQLPEFIQTHAHWVSDAIQSSHALRSLLLLPSIFPSIRIFSNELALRIRWPKYWSFSFNSVLQWTLRADLL